MEITDFNNIDFNLPKNQSNVIKVIGVGGGGSNAVNYMYTKGIQGVDFVVCNTDSQALTNSPVPIKIQLGASLTEGLGAGANPEVGEQSALESSSDIYTMFGEKTKMVFITVGMGGGTGTGAAPVIAKMARENGLLTIGIVTTPFSFEGKTRNDQAQKGIDKLRENVDSLIVINNNKLREVYGNLGFRAGFSKADEVLATAARGIAEVITHHYTQNIDFKDAKTVLENSGSAIMGSATASGANRSQDAITKALESPLLNDNKITGAKNVLLLIVSGTSEITIDEIGEINDFIQSQAKTNVNIIMGVGEDESLGDSIAVTVVATGFNQAQQQEIAKVENKRIIYNLDEDTVKTETTLTSIKQKCSPENKTFKPTEKPTKIVHQLEEEKDKLNVDKNGQIRIFDIEVDAQFISKKSVNDVIDDENTGFLDANISSALSELKKQKGIGAKNELIPTTSQIENLEIQYKEVIHDEFIITDVSQNIKDIEVIDHKIIQANKQETQSVFDLPIENTTNKQPDETLIKNDLEEAKGIDVIDTEIVSQNKKVYNLEEYIELEKTLEQAKPKSVIVDQSTIQPELDFTTKTVSKEDIGDVLEGSDVEVSPLNSTISELKSRTDSRKEKMKRFNHKFRNNNLQNIEELEKEPAYKRNNTELDDTSNLGKNISRTSLDIDGKDVNLRSNNSFLHDNVD